MSEFHISGNFNASNFQAGDYNTMANTADGYVDWEKLKCGFEAINSFNLTGNEKQMLNESMEAIDKKDSKSLSNLVKDHLWDFGKNIFCNMAAGALVELMKVLVLA